MNRLVCLGMVVKDMVFHVPQIPPVAQKLTAHSVRTGFGGMAATAAAAAAALGGQVEFWGRVGDDETGQEALRAFAARGVETQVKVQQATQSPMAAVMVDDRGERMLAAYMGQLDVAADWLPLERLAYVQAVHADFRWVEGACALYLAARQRGLPRVLDADAGNVQALHALVPLADHIIFSERGLAGYAPGMALEQALANVATDPHAVVGVTLGERGSLFVHQGQVHAFAAPRITPQDTNGAGDVFHGAYALALARGMLWTDAVHYASATAALKCTRSHGWGLLPTHEDVVRFMKEPACAI